MSYLPKELNDLNKRFRLLKTTTTKVLGADMTSDVEIGQFYCNFKSRGGTETVVNGKVVIIETADIVTTWRPDIQKGCKIVDMETDEMYEIIGKPEDFSLSHQALKFKVQAMGGKY